MMITSTTQLEKIMDKDYPLLTVIIVALSLMMAVQILGMAWDSAFGVAPSVTYECDFKMKDHILTMPCEIRGVHYA